MRAALLALLVAAEVAAASPRVLNRLGDYWRLDRRNRLSTGASAAPDASLLRFLPSTASIPGGECSGQTVTGTRGESINFSRASSANCQNADGTWVSVTSNQPRVSSLIGQPAMMVEQEATNLVLRSRDLENGVWSSTNLTCVRNATGITGVSSSATTCTTGTSTFLGTVTQSITTSGTRITSAYIKRVAGSSALEMTRNNGGSWTTLNSSNCYNATTYAAQSINSSTWSRCYIYSTVTNPIVGFRTNSENDSFIFDAVQDENLNFIDTPTSPIFTSGTSATRSGEVAYVSAPTGFVTGLGCMAAKAFKTSAIFSGGNPRILQSGNGIIIAQGSNVYAATVSNFVIDYRTTFATLLDVIVRWSTSANQLALVVNGTTSTTAYTSSMIGSTVRFGIDASGFQSINGWLANIRLGATTGDCEP